MKITPRSLYQDIRFGGDLMSEVGAEISEQEQFRKSREQASAEA